LKQTNQSGEQHYKRSTELESIIKNLAQELEYANKAAKEGSENVNGLSNKLRQAQQ